MDWIERLFGISPDSGNGLTEFLLLLVPILIILTLTVFIGRRVRSRK